MIDYSIKRIGCGSRIWTDDLRVMSPTSYHTAPSRVRLLLLMTVLILSSENWLRKPDLNLRPSPLIYKELSPISCFSLSTHIESGCGSRIWTDDLRVMSPTSYHTAPSRVRYLSVLLHYLLLNGCGSRIWTYDLRVMSPTSYHAAPSRVRLQSGADYNGRALAMQGRRLKKVVNA